MLMKLDTRITSITVLLILAAIVIPFTADWHLPLLDGVVVTWIENGQALWLLFGALFTAWYIKPLSRPEGALGRCMVAGTAGAKHQLGTRLFSGRAQNHLQGYLGDIDRRTRTAGIFLENAASRDCASTA